MYLYVSVQKIPADISFFASDFDSDHSLRKIKKGILEVRRVLITNGTLTNCLKYKGGSDEWFVYK